MTIEVRRTSTRDSLGQRRLWGSELGDRHLSGTQTVVRFLVEVLRRDRAQGLNTAAFVSGYQGSPLGGLDLELQRALPELGVDILHQPAVNEELAATSIMGSQLASIQPHPLRDGVLGVWYAKSPGLDRSVDALRHGNFAGSSPHGGAVILVGDDPAAKSSTLPSASESIFADMGMPVLFPRTLQQVLDLGQHAAALSRHSGAWVGMKLVSSVADAEGSVTIGPGLELVLPEGPRPSPPTGDLLTPATIEREHEVLGARLALAGAYGDANGLNRLVVDPENSTMALVAAGSVFSELCEALLLLGLDEDALRHAGVALGEITMPFPLGAGFTRQLAPTVRDLIIVEERRELVESQLLSLMGRGGGPRIWGRLDPEGQPFIPKAGCLEARQLANLLYPLMADRLGEIVQQPQAPRKTLKVSSGSVRMPWYCPGCPHSVSTAVPDHHPVGLGIGCHSIVSYMPEERVGRSVGLTQMGGEGAQWIGMAPFVSDGHLIQNMGDGTFFHSGHLAIRAAIDADATMTFKILWNGVSAMTGGQRVAGQTTLEELVRILLLEGVREVVITTDDLRRHRGTKWPDRVSLRDRAAVLDVQRDLASREGVTVMIHDQACANELRRSRKAGLSPKPALRVVINERVCEGCGDCQTKSNCLALQTVSTTFGPKTKIDEGSCNVDLSCLEGDCPAFMLVDASSPQALSATEGTAAKDEESDLPPAPRRSADDAMAIRFAGIGGTGIVTVAHIVARAALIDGLESWGLDQTGVSQKAGSVISDLRIGAGSQTRSNVFGEGQIDLLVACDLMAAAHPNALKAASPERTIVVGSTAVMMSGPMVIGSEEREVPEGELLERLRSSTRWEHASLLRASDLVVAHGLSDATANVALLGVALQRGLLPVTSEALSQAIEENGVAVDQNLLALEIGRRWVVSSGSLAPPQARTTSPARPSSLDGLAAEHMAAIEILAEELVLYQNVALRERFLAFLGDVWQAEAGAGGDGALTRSAAEGAFKLFAYKDEYEVARLLLDHPAPSRGTSFLLSPPLFHVLGVKKKIRFGRWTRPALRVLHSSRRLRGTALDPFGRSTVRRAERKLVDEYLLVMEEQCRSLSPSSLAVATAIARLPGMIRGYESTKLEAIARYERELATLRSSD